MKSALIQFATCMVLPLAVQAQGVLKIKHDEGALTFGEWEYREVSTASRWRIGCHGWDFLQGSGFFPSTWYQYINPTDSVEYQVERTFRATYCGAQPDSINFLDVKHTTADGTVLDGFIKVFPNSELAETSITVRCAPAGVIASPCTSCTLTCEEAHLPWDGRGTAEITVVWEDL